MPSVSEKQARFMAAAAHNPKFAKKAGIPQGVAMDYNQADKQRSQASALRKHNPGYAHSSPGGHMSYSHKPQKKASASNYGGASVGGGT